MLDRVEDRGVDAGSKAYIMGGDLPGCRCLVAPTRKSRDKPQPVDGHLSTRPPGTICYTPLRRIRNRYATLEVVPPMTDPRPRVPSSRTRSGSVAPSTARPSSTVATPDTCGRCRDYPAWYFPLTDLDAALVPNGTTLRSPSRGEGTRYDLVVGDVTIPDAAWRHLDSPVEELRDLVRIEWSAMDAWFEENVEVFVHPRSPEVRIDALPSSRHVRVTVDGDVVADSTHATVLFETGLPARYYLPKSDVRMDLLTPTTSTSACRTRGGRTTGTSPSTASSTMISCGGTRHRCPSPPRSPVSCASTTRKSTSNWTASRWTDPRPSSAEIASQV